MWFAKCGLVIPIPASWKAEIEADFEQRKNKNN
jgi:hypothetical protein